MGLRHRWSVGALAAAASVVALGTPVRAHAYRTFRDDPALGLDAAPAFEQTPVAWELYAGSLDPTHLVDLEDSAIAAFDTWAAPPCSSFRGNYRGLTSAPGARGDGRSTITIITSGWVESGFPPGRGATTDVQIRRNESTGAAVIAEADVYLNMQQNAFAFGRGAGPGELDLQGVLTHEIGHLLGLLHPCEDDGAAAPLCNASYEDRCLYPDYLGPSQRSLAPDDVAGVCALYPRMVDLACSAGCPIYTHCVSGACIPDCRGCECDVGPPDANCASAPQCYADLDCSAGDCVLWGPAARTCAPAGALGTQCDIGGDCDSGLCIHSNSLGRSVCTSACRTSSECSSGDLCTAVGGVSVCAPAMSHASACSASAHGANGAASFVVLVLMPCIVRSWRTRRRWSKR